MPKKPTARELEAIIRESHRKLMLKKRERELRDYLKNLAPWKKQRTAEYQELKKIVDQRHKTTNIVQMLCSACDHKCHMFAEHGWCHDPACPCRHCDCPRCDLEYNYN